MFELNSKSHSKQINNSLVNNFASEFSIPYATGTFILKPFSKYIRKQGLMNNIVYSEPLISDGITWRIKVYPNGTGIY